MAYFFSDNVYLGKIYSNWVYSLQMSRAVGYDYYLAQIYPRPVVLNAKILWNKFFYSIWVWFTIFVQFFAPA